MTVPAFLIVVAALLPSQGVRDSIRLRVLAINDFHGALDAKVASWSNGRPVGGAAALAGMMDRLQAECACATIRLDGGDEMQGTPASNLTHGRTSVAAMGAMHIAVAAIGNHEFDWGIDTLAARIRESRYAWVSSNIRELATRQQPAWARPFTIVEAGGARIAVVGYTTPSTTTATNPANVATLGFLGPPALDSANAAARESRPDYVIVVAHAGAFCNRDSGCAGEIVDLANALTHKPDLIVSGHTHSLVNTVINGIPIVQARSNGTSMDVVDFVQTDSGRVVRARVEDVWADRERPDPAAQQIVAAANEAVRPLTSQHVATLAQDLTRADSSALGDMIADAMRQLADADVGLANRTGMRADLVAGAITWGDVYQVLPFGNWVVTVPVTGAVLRQTIEHALGANESNAAVSGLLVRWDRSAPAGHRIVSITLEGGRPVSDEVTYTLATFDFLANGGSGYSMLRSLPAHNTGTDELDAFIAFLRRQPQPVRVVRPYALRIAPDR
ncbi:MAG: bifunctional metallophosphatase/5'-nucleotidase [Gemmatimonadales bacterium]